LKTIGHVQVRGQANPYDPAWEEYFEERLSAKMAQDLSGRRAVQRLWQRQGGKCPVCGQGLRLTDNWHLHHKEWQVHGGSEAWYNRRLLHANCHRQVHSQGWVVE
jgi:RNA-directed DNA polymerase